MTALARHRLAAADAAVFVCQRPGAWAAPACAGTAAPLTGAAPLLPLDAVSLLAALASWSATLATVVLHRQRLTALILLGAVGLLVALIFVKFSAPDLALTQLSVEVVTVVLLLLALYFLPQRRPSESSRSGACGTWPLAVAGRRRHRRPWPGRS